MKTYEFLTASLLALSLPLACDSDEDDSTPGAAGAAGTENEGGNAAGGQPSNGTVGGEGFGDGGRADAGAAAGGAPVAESGGAPGGDGSIGGEASGGAGGAVALEQQFAVTATTICETGSLLNCANEATCIEHWETGYVVAGCASTWRAYVDCVAALEVTGLICDDPGDLGPNFDTEGAACIEALVAHGECVGG